MPFLYTTFWFLGHWRAADATIIISYYAFFPSYYDSFLFCLYLSALLHSFIPQVIFSGDFIYYVPQFFEVFFSEVHNTYAAVFTSSFL